MGLRVLIKFFEYQIKNLAKIRFCLSSGDNSF